MQLSLALLLARLLVTGAMFQPKETSDEEETAPLGVPPLPIVAIPEEEVPLPAVLALPPPVEEAAPPVALPSQGAAAPTGGDGSPSQITGPPTQENILQVGVHPQSPPPATPGGVAFANDSYVYNGSSSPTEGLDGLHAWRRFRTHGGGLAEACALSEFGSSPGVYLQVEFGNPPAIDDHDDFQDLQDDTLDADYHDPLPATLASAEGPTAALGAPEAGASLAAHPSGTNQSALPLRPPPERDLFNSLGLEPAADM